MATRKQRERRDAAIAREYARVGNMAEIGRRHGLTRERVRQVLEAQGVDLQGARQRAAKNRRR